VYRWVAFLPSRIDERVPVANRYFGVFQDGSLKMRGIELRRRDAPLFIAELQEELLNCLAQAQHASELEGYLPQAFSLLRRCLSNLRAGRIPLHSLLVSQKLSRTLPEYRSPSPAARAAAQLQDIGKTLRPGQCVRFIYTLGEPGVYAWDLAETLEPSRVDVSRYITLLLRAAATVLQPLGYGEPDLRQRLLEGVIARKTLFSAPPAWLSASNRQSLQMPG
jgi:DNA polymerase-2